MFPFIGSSDDTVGKGGLPPPNLPTAHCPGGGFAPFDRALDPDTYGKPDPSSAKMPERGSPRQKTHSLVLNTMLWMLAVLEHISGDVPAARYGTGATLHAPLSASASCHTL